MKSKRFGFPAAVFTSFLLAYSPAQSVHAATLSWDGSDSTAWATGTNWTGDISHAKNLASGDWVSEVGIGKGRDPKDWQLEASNDGSVRITLNNRTGESFDERRQYSPTTRAKSD